MSFRFKISSDGLLDACHVDRISASAVEFVDYKNKKPLIIIESTLSLAVGNITPKIVNSVEDVEVEALIAKDGKNFLRHELCTIERVSLKQTLEEILCSPNDGNLCNIDYNRKYLRIYLDKHPRIRDIFNFAYLNSIVVSTTGSRSNDQAPSSNVTNTPDPPALSNSKETLGVSEVDDELAVCVAKEESSQSIFRDQNIGLWVSCEGCTTPLHFDLCHGFLAQIVGRKTFILAPAEDSTLLHYWLQKQKQQEPGNESRNGTTSPVDFGKWLDGDQLERKKYHRIDEVGWYIAQLYPGDVLYTPPGWWHYVVSETASASLLVPFDPNPGRETLPANVMMVG